MDASRTERVVVIGAGLGGLSAALRLSHAGLDVTVVERSGSAGGKLRTMSSAAGPVDAGPTVVTLRAVFDALFASVGARISDHVDFEPEPVLARHWWADGSTLDLFADPAANERAIRAFSGDRSAGEFRAFHRDADRLFSAFEAPMMRSPAPDLVGLARQIARRPGILRAMAPAATLAGSLARRFHDPRLRQLFGRYATYIGGSPLASPAVLSVIWRAEAGGVWRVRGGIKRLAGAIESLAKQRGAHFRFKTMATRIHVESGAVKAVELTNGERIEAGHVVFNGDPAALAAGLLGNDVADLIPAKAVRPRALSAWVWSFASPVSGPPLAHHNVFFGREPRAEFDDLAKGRMPADPTLYVCAQDSGAEPAARVGRFEIIMNAPPVDMQHAGLQREFETCRTRTFETLSRMGVTFADMPGRTALTTPADFAEMFPGSAGSLYGRSPHGFLASFRRPVARTRNHGLFLAGGGVHPGPGMPMAVRSGGHAAAAILSNLASTSAFRRTAMRGGMSTDSPRMAAAPSRSSVS